MAVVRISDTQACVDTCVAFRATPSAGAYGHVADAGAEILRHHGIGPLDKWVDDHLFIRILKEFLGPYNQQCAQWHKDLSMRGMHQSGSRIWFGGHVFNDDSIKEFEMKIVNGPSKTYQGNHTGQNMTIALDTV